jgi:hypothetical protein
LSAGEEVHWELLDRAELRLVRNQPPPPSHHSPPPIARTSQPRSK